MNIRHLESFVCIVERGSFAAAAEVLFTTQPTISARIQELERRFGVPLFDRSRHRARLTPKGEELLPYARQVVELAQQIARRIGDPSSVAGTIRIGCVGLVAKTLLPTLVAAVRQRYPNVVLKVHVFLARTVFAMLEAHEIDMALVTTPVTVPDVETHPLGTDDFVWLASPALEVADGPLRPADLERLPVFGFPAESHHFPVIERWFRDNGAVYRPAVSCNNMDALADLTARGAGVALLPRGCYRVRIDAGELRELDTRPRIPPVGFVAIHKRDAHLHPLVATIATLAGDLAAGERQTEATAG